MNSTSLSIALALTLLGALRAQPKVFVVSPTGDMTPGAAADSIPGLAGRYRQQILIAPSRLQGLVGKTLEGLWFRRTLTNPDALVGGAIDLTVSLHTTNTPPAEASMVFEVNAPGAARREVFRGAIQVPHSPALGPAPTPWSTDNAFRIAFAQSFTYQGGTLVIDIAGGPTTASSGPVAWYLDHERQTHDGTATSYGTSCSNFKLRDGLSLVAEEKGLQVGGTVRVTAFGRPNTQPLLFLGITPIPSGVDLATLGAPGCLQYLTIFASLGIQYQPPIRGFDPVYAQLLLPVPSDPSLVSAQVSMQTADIETSLPASTWSNPAGLTTSNGITLKIASTLPTLGMATVHSADPGPGQPFPAAGRVDVETGPVFRILYR